MSRLRAALAAALLAPTVGDGTDWTWRRSGHVAFEAHGRVVRWCVDARDLGMDRTGGIHAAFHVSAPGGGEYSQVASEMAAAGVRRVLHV